MRILGLSDTQLPAAALVIGDALVATATARRPTRGEGGEFPWDPLEAVLRQAGLELADVHRVVFGSVSGSKPGPGGGRDVLGKVRKGARFLGQVALKETGTWVVRASYRREQETERLRELGFAGDVKTLEHAHALATGAWRLQPTEKALVLTADTGADGTAVTVSHGSNEGLRLIYRQGALSSLRNLDRVVARALGVERRELGLAAPYLAEQGGVPAELERLFGRELRASTGGFNLALTSHTRSLRRRLAGFAPEEIAAAYQANLERQFRRLLRHWIRRSGREHVVLAGDAFLNRGLVRSLLTLDEVEQLFVAPADEGAQLALGAAMEYADLGPGYRPPLYLGSGFGDDDALAALADAGLETRPARVDRVARRLRDGAVIARCAERDSWGTWVEGHRSALWRPSAAATARVERRLGRRAHELPTVLADADTALRVAPDLERAATGGRYGAAPVEVARRWRERLAPAMLSDGTATLQGVTDADAPTLATLLHDGGDGVLLATALRLEGRPRPRTPEEIVGAFLASRLDHLWLGPYLVDHPDPA